MLAATSGKCPTDDQNRNNFEVNNCGSASGLCACSGVCVWGRGYAARKHVIAQ